jgi:hypothetical protein
VGREATCHARLGAQSGEGRALLETDELIFRGGFRVKVPLKDITEVVTKGSTLTLTWPGGKLTLTLGDSVAAWAKAITSPKTVIEKLGVKPGLQVVIVGRFETDFRTAIMNALGVKPGVRPVPGCDLVFVLLVHENDVEKLAELMPAIAPDGGIWAVYPRGRKDLSEDTVRKAGRAAGLVDIKVVRISEKHGALKLVIPKAARRPAAR